MPKSIGGYDLGPTIGMGTSGRVRAATTQFLNPQFVPPVGRASLSSQRGGEMRFAVRQVDNAQIRAERGEEKLKRDITNIKYIHHPHILTLYEVLRTRSNMYIVTEMAPNAISLLRRVASQGKMDEPDARDVFQRVVCALRFCHKKKIPHRNIKPSTILLVPSGESGGGRGMNRRGSAMGSAATMLTHSVKISGVGMATVQKPPKHALLAGNDSPMSSSDGSGEAKIISPNAVAGPTFPTSRDLGKSAANASSSPAAAASSPVTEPSRQQLAFASMFQHPFYAPPEAFKDPLYDAYAADVWSLGVLLYYMLSGALPFESNLATELIGSLEIGDFRMPRHFTDGARRLVARMLTVEPRRRITIDEIINDPWFMIDFNTALIDLGAFEYRPSPIADDFAEQARQRDLMAMRLGGIGGGGGGGHHHHYNMSRPPPLDGIGAANSNGSFGAGGSASLQNGSFGTSAAGSGGAGGGVGELSPTAIGSPMSPQKTARFALPSTTVSSGRGSSPAAGSVAGGGGAGASSSPFAASTAVARRAAVSSPHSSPDGPSHHHNHHHHTSGGGGRGGGGANSYLSLAPVPLDAFGLVLRMLATNYADMSSRQGGGAGANQHRHGGVIGGGASASSAIATGGQLLSSTLVGSPQRRAASPRAAPWRSHFGSHNGLLVPSDALLTTPMCHATLRRTLLLTNTLVPAAKTGGGGGADGAGGGAGASAVHRSGGATAHHSSTTMRPSGNLPPPHGHGGGGGGGPRQDIMTAMQTLRCHPQLDDGSGDVTGYFMGGKHGQLVIRVRVTATIVATLSLVVVAAERGSASDFAVFFSQLQQALGLAVVSVQKDPAVAVQQASD